MSTQNLMMQALLRKNTGRPPVWFMRQAGRYHSHYQNLKKTNSFIDLCKKPEVACEATMGPIRDFGFDSAILFSDLLFPLEAMGMGLRYEEGPKLDWHLKDKTDLNRLLSGRELVKQLSFQSEALQMIRRALPPEKTLLGFVGGPLTLFFYAVEGSHQGSLGSALQGLTDGRYEGFCTKLLPLLAENLKLQARSGADCVVIIDTCGGELSPEQYKKHVIPVLKVLLDDYRASSKVPLFYYSKGTGPEHWETLRDLPIAGIGVDWCTPISEVLERFGDQWAIQGNFDPNEMLKPRAELEPLIRDFFKPILRLPRDRLKGWICGLGHGVLPKTPEENVRLFLRIQKELFT